MNQHGTIVKLVSDKEIGTKVYVQLCDIIEAIRLDKAGKGLLVQSAIELSRKLEYVKYHRDNLLRICTKELN